MNDPSRYTEPKADTTRRWVKVIGIIVLLVAVLVVVLLLAGGGHRPRRHSSGVDAGLGRDRGSAVSEAIVSRP
jgi:hypothetical protein